MKTLFTLILAFGLSIPIAAQAKKNNQKTGSKPIATQYGALAIDRSNGFYYGFSYDYSTLAEAEKKALDECKKKGGDCKVVVSVSGKACIAYRTIDGNVGTAYGWGIASTKDAADDIAKKECLQRSNGITPNNFVWSCNSATEELKIIKNDNAAEGSKKHRLTDENGEFYDFEGNLINNKPHGSGVSTYVKSGNIYKGNYVNGQIEGNGEAIFKSGDHYIGGMSKGKFSGHGIYTHKSGNKYEGNFVNSQKQGKGRQTDADGGYYEGDFEKGLMHGYGKYVDASGKIVFEGKMENDNPVKQ